MHKLQANTTTELTPYTFPFFFLYFTAFDRENSIATKFHNTILNRSCRSLLNSIKMHAPNEFKCRHRHCESTRLRIFITIVVCKVVSDGFDCARECLKVVLRRATPVAQCRFVYCVHACICWAVICAPRTWCCIECVASVTKYRNRIIYYSCLHSVDACHSLFLSATRYSHMQKGQPLFIYT